MRRHVQHQMTISPKKDRENWWVKMVEKTEVAVGLCNSQRLLYATPPSSELQLVKLYAVKIWPIIW